MAVRMTKPWQPLSASGIAVLAGHMGVYELANAAGEVLLIGCADARSRFGLRGELVRLVASPPTGAAQYRVEITTAYLTRWQELMMVHAADHGTLPPLNPAADAARLGRLSPA